MPIKCQIQFEPIGQEKFHALDRVVMGHAFQIHNSIGRFCDERIYQDELGLRCEDSGIPCLRETEIRAIHQDFSKSYFLDLVAGGGCIYELKAADSISPAHQNQLIHYLMLSGCHHGKLLNFRPRSVQSRFVSTTLNLGVRRTPRFTESDFDRFDPFALALRDTLSAILEDWGAHLDLNLYREALLHFTGGGENGVQPVALRSGGRMIGFQRMCLLNPDCAWHLSAMKTHLDSHEKHIRRLLHHTKLKQLHWINLNRNDILLRTIRNDSVTK